MVGSLAIGLAFGERITAYQALAPGWRLRVLSYRICARRKSHRAETCFEHGDQTGQTSQPVARMRLDRNEIRSIGRDLQRPEAILAEPDGTLWAADARGGLMRINADGTQQLIAQAPDPHFDMNVDARSSLLFGTLPNGLAF